MLVKCVLCGLKVEHKFQGNIYHVRSLVHKNVQNAIFLNKRQQTNGVCVRGHVRVCVGGVASTPSPPH